MQTINLKQYYPFCKEDIFVEVSDEIVEAFLLDKRAEAARDLSLIHISEPTRRYDRKRRISRIRRTDTAIV